MGVFFYLESKITWIGHLDQVFLFSSLFLTLFVNPFFIYLAVFLAFYSGYTVHRSQKTYNRSKKVTENYDLRPVDELRGTTGRGDQEEEGDYPSPRMELSDVFEGHTGRGYKLAISRDRPRWCVGHLDTWEIDEPISLSDIAQEFGGQKFSLKVLDNNGKYVKGTSYKVSIDGEPKRDGRIIKQPVERSEFGELSGGEGMVKQMFGMMKEQNEQSLKMIRDMQKMQRPPDNFESLAGMVKAAEKLKGLAGLFGGGDSDGAGGSSLLTPEIMKVFAEQLSPGQQQQQQQQQPDKRDEVINKLIKNQQKLKEKLSQVVTNQQQQALQYTPIENSQVDNDTEEVFIEDVLEGLSPSEIGNAFSDAFNKMSESQQMTALSSFSGVAPENLGSFIPNLNKDTVADITESDDSDIDE